jgi:hypothetical protein
VGASLFKPPAEIVWPPGVVTKFDTTPNVPFYCLTIDDGWYGERFREQFRFALNKGLFPFTWFANGVGIINVREDVALVNDPPYSSTFPEWFYWARLTVGYHTLYHPSVEDQRKNYNRSRWIEDYEEWLERATETFGEKQKKIYETADEMGWADRHVIVQPFARAAGGYFSDPFMEMCEEKGLTPYGWSADPYTLNRGAVIEPGDIFLTHWRSSEWKWFNMLAEKEESHELISRDITQMIELEQQHREHLWDWCTWRK